MRREKKWFKTKWLDLQHFEYNSWALQNANGSILLVSGSSCVCGVCTLGMNKKYTIPVPTKQQESHWSKPNIMVLPFIRKIKVQQIYTKPFLACVAQSLKAIKLLRHGDLQMKAKKPVDWGEGGSSAHTIQHNIWCEIKHWRVRRAEELQLPCVAVGWQAFPGLHAAASDCVGSSTAPI